MGLNHRNPQGRTGGEEHRFTGGSAGQVLTYDPLDPLRASFQDPTGGGGSGTAVEVGPLNIPSGTIIAAVADTDADLEWLFTGLKVSDGTPMTPLGGTIPNPGDTLFTAAEDLIVMIAYVGNRSGGDVTGFAMTIGGLWIPGPSSLGDGVSLLLTNYGWVPRNAAGGSP